MRAAVCVSSARSNDELGAGRFSPQSVWLASAPQVRPAPEIGCQGNPERHIEIVAGFQQRQAGIAAVSACITAGARRDFASCLLGSYVSFGRTMPI